MGLGRVLLVLGPVLVLVHILSDSLATDKNPIWTYTIASYDIAVITAIIGIALTFRAPPGDHSNP